MRWLCRSLDGEGGFNDQPTLRLPQHFHMSSVVPAVLVMIAVKEVPALEELDLTPDLRLYRSASPR